MNALRFVVEGDANAFTVVDGVKCPMHTYDLVVTPSYSWHDHHNASERHIAWLDVLDVALFVRLNQLFFIPADVAAQPVRNVAGAAGPPWLRPEMCGGPEDPPLRFPWTETVARLRALAEEAVDRPAADIVLEYVNPSTGGPVFKTMSCTVRLLRPGERTRLCRRTSSAIFFVVSGQGRTRAGESVLRWGRHDCFAVPNWCWHSLENRSTTEDAILFSVSDAAALRALGMYREEIENHNGGG
jgi:gentisate 1,2-dioxygenase